MDLVKRMKGERRKRMREDPGDELGNVLSSKLRRREYLGAVVAPRMNLVAREQMLAAVLAALQLVARGASSAPVLWETGDPLFLVFSFAQPLPFTTPLSGVTLPLPHPFRKGAECCLITRDPHTHHKGKYAHIVKVLSVSRLRKRYARFEARRRLARSYDIFFAEPQILSLLPKLLGSTFFDRRKQPIAIDLGRGTAAAQAQIDSALGAARWFARGVTSVTQFGVSTQSAKELCDNAMALAGEVAARLPGGWAALQSVGIKGEKTMMLPVYRHLMEVPRSMPSFLVSVERAKHEKDSSSEGDGEGEEEEIESDSEESEEQSEGESEDEE